MTLIKIGHIIVEIPQELSLGGGGGGVLVRFWGFSLFWRYICVCLEGVFFCISYHCIILFEICFMIYQNASKASKSVSLVYWLKVQLV